MSADADPRAAGPAPPAADAAARAHGVAVPLGAAPRYEGLVTRAVAFTIDAAAINLVAVVVGAAVGLSLSVLSVPQEAENALLGIGGLSYLLWSVAYFVGFWSATGQTPGNRLLGIRVCREDGRALRPGRALLRLIALTIAAIPFLAGFVPILFDERRRGLHDMIAGTVVVDGPVHAQVRERLGGSARAGDGARRARRP